MFGNVSKHVLSTAKIACRVPTRHLVRAVSIEKRFYDNANTQHMFGVQYPCSCSGKGTRLQIRYVKSDSAHKNQFKDVH